MLNTVKALIANISKWGIEKVEAFYVYLVCYWEGFIGLYRSNIPVQSGPYRGFMERQLELRGCNQYIDEFERLCNTYLQTLKEIQVLKRYIEEKYKNNLENLVRKRLNNLSEDEKRLLEHLASWCYTRTEYFRIRDRYNFKNNLPINDKDAGEEFLIKNGLLILTGYYTVTTKRYDYTWYDIPPWIKPIIDETYSKLTEIPKEDENILMRVVEENVIMGSCPLCNTDVLGSEIHRKVFSKYFHEQCLKNIGGIPTIGSESSLREYFEKLKIIPGIYYHEVEVGGKRIDLIVRTGDTDWIIEIEWKLNYEAIGQVIVYENEWKKNHPGRQTKKAIICAISSQELVQAANKEGIIVFSYY